MPKPAQSIIPLSGVPAGPEPKNRMANTSLPLTTAVAPVNGDSMAVLVSFRLLASRPAIFALILLSVRIGAPPSPVSQFS